MLNDIKGLIKSQKQIYHITQNIFWGFERIGYKSKWFLRRFNLIPNNYKKLKLLKGKHTGERCFIVATGPSLMIKDLEKLKDEVTFSMNSIILSFENTHWRPSYYGIQDPYVFESLQENIMNVDIEKIFVGDRINRKFQVSNHSYIFPHNLLDHKKAYHKVGSKFSEDISLDVYDGYSITYSLIQIAIYMGFKEIYLLGADTTYTKGKQHFIDYNLVDPAYAEIGEKMIEAYKVAKIYADNHDVSIYNATRGGMLEVFPRVDLDEVLSNKEYT